MFILVFFLKKIWINRLTVPQGLEASEQGFLARLYGSSFSCRVSPSTVVPHLSVTPMGNAADSCNLRTNSCAFPALPQRSSYKVRMPWLNIIHQARCSTTSCQNWSISKENKKPENYDTGNKSCQINQLHI